MALGSLPGDWATVCSCWPFSKLPACPPETSCSASALILCPLGNQMIAYNTVSRAGEPGYQGRHLMVLMAEQAMGHSRQ